jgi:hypothetical protein
MKQEGDWDDFQNKLLADLGDKSSAWSRRLSNQHTKIDALERPKRSSISTTEKKEYKHPVVFINVDWR